MRRAWPLVAVLVVAGCRIEPDGAVPAADPPAVVSAARVAGPAAPDPTPEAVRDWLGAERYRERWERWPGTLPLRASAEPHHGALLTAYANPLATDGMERGLPVLPSGSILIVEDHAPDSTLASISVMLQTGDRDADDRGWYFVRLGSAGEVGPPESESCAACHVLDPDRVFGAQIGTPWPIDSTGALPLPADSLARDPAPPAAEGRSD